MPIAAMQHAAAGGSPNRKGVEREGMDEWSREKDNRMRALRMKRERGDPLCVSVRMGGPAAPLAITHS
eukprot:gene54504-37292_t